MMSARLGKFADLVGIGLIIAISGVAYARTLAPGLTWANNGTDGGDLITAAATGGVAHPTGYPTYLALARLFQLVPMGDLALRTNLLSMCAALLAVACVYVLVRAALAEQHWHALAAAAIAALCLAFSPVFWSQAVVAEVYSLNALFVALLVLFTLWNTRRAFLFIGWASRLQALVVGLAMGNHVTVALPAALWLATSGIYAPPRMRLRLLAHRLVWIVGGMLIYLYIPLCASAHPPVNWGNPVTWEGIWWLMSGQPYRALAFGLPRTFFFGRVAAWAALLVEQFGWIGMVLGFFGLLYGGATTRALGWITAGMALGYSVFAVMYNTADSFAYLVPVYLIFATWIGFGTATLLRIVERWRFRYAPATAALLALLLLWHIPATAYRVDASKDQRALEYATRVLASTPPDAIVFTSSDRDTFALWYYHYALHERRDIFVIVEPLLEFAWYREHMRAVYPTLHISDHRGEGWARTMARDNPSPGTLCRTLLDHDSVIECCTRQESCITIL
jgi:hypothetical protein